MDIYLKRWLNISLFNLLIVAAIGTVLRYKIAYALPIVNQKNLLHGHSHFAFSGWVTQTLLVLLVAYLSAQRQQQLFKSYHKLLQAHLVVSYGMLIAFPLQGYAAASIAFSTASIFVVYAFAFYCWKDLNRLQQKNISHYWIKAALVFNVLSSLGTFALAWMMATKSMHQTSYLASVYFFLHFQYNGWFFFACMGLFYAALPAVQSDKKSKLIFWLFAAACLPAYFLSALWMPIPVWVYVLVVLAAFVQLIAWIIFSKQVFQHLTYLKTQISNTGKWLLLLSACALTVKFLLQLGSTIPELSHLAYGFRPIVIAYLHLVLLGVITLFLIGCIFSRPLMHRSAVTRTGIIMFVSGVLLNEIILMIQGVAALSYNSVPSTNESLLLVALLMFTGILLVCIAQWKKQHSSA